jgi:protein-disulfide isomerase
VDAWRQLPVQGVGLDPERDFVRGPKDAAVSIVTFSDFECNHCRDANIELERIYRQHPDRVQIVFKNYPLDMSCNEKLTRPNFMYSCRAAVMARCAGAQDRFWEMHDAIYGLPAVSLGALEEIAGEIGVAGEAYDACVSGEGPMSDIHADIALGTSLGVTGTPSVFINGRKLSGFRVEFIEAIVDHLASEADGPQS